MSGPLLPQLLLAATVALLAAGVGLYASGSARARHAAARIRTEDPPAPDRARALRSGPEFNRLLSRWGPWGGGAMVLAAWPLVGPVVALLGAAGVVLGARQGLRRRAGRERGALAEHLPEVVELLAAAVGAGVSVPNALAMAAREQPGPVRALLDEAVREMALGESLASAMQRLQERAPSRELSVLASTLVVQQRAGGDLVAALRGIAAHLQARRDLGREVATATAGARFVTHAVIGMAAAVLLLLEAVAPGTLRRLSASPAGVAIVVAAAALLALGLHLIRRIVEVEP